MKNLIILPICLFSLFALAVEPPPPPGTQEMTQPNPPPASDGEVIGTIQETTPETKKIVNKIMKRKKKTKEAKTMGKKKPAPKTESPAEPSK